MLRNDAIKDLDDLIFGDSHWQPSER